MERIAGRLAILLVAVLLGLLGITAAGAGVASATGLHRDGFVRSRHSETNVCLFWTVREVSWHLNENPDAADSSFDEVEAAVRRSFDTWAAVECSDLTFSYEGRTSNTSIGFRQGASNNINLLVFRTKLCEDVVADDHACWTTPGACANAFDCWNHPSGVIALTTTNFNTASGVILDSDIEFNSAGLRFTTSDGPTCQLPTDSNCVEFDVQNTATHEIGHMVGFDHSLDTSATMFAQAEPGETSKRELADDDTDALCHVYPAGGPPRTCTPSGRILVTPTGKGSDGGCGKSAAVVLVLLGMPGVLCRRRPRRT